MAFTFKNGKHYRNPSGCHNKVKWFLFIYVKESL